MILSKGNKKLPTTTAIFNLPSQITCPNATEECKKWCYAKKAERMYPNVLPFRMKNLELTKDTEARLINDVNEELKKSQKVTHVRIHESGDYYNQQYLNKWFVIAVCNPNLTFYSYTKMWNLDYSRKPSNMIVLLSDDTGKWQRHYYKFDGVTYVEDDKNKRNTIKQHLRNTINGKQLERKFTCVGDCKVCNKCFNITLGKFKQIQFNKH